MRIEIPNKNVDTINPKTRMIETRVVGTSFDNRQSVVALLTEREKVYLIREPENPFDSNAIKVVRWDHRQFGYLNRELASHIAPKMDRYMRPAPAFVTVIMGGYYPGSCIGVWIRFFIPE
jgi:hypothetical protein